MRTGAAESAVHQAGAPPAACIAHPGENCWRVEPADRFSCIQDAADYFRLVRRAMLDAKRTIFMLGWDITAHVDLLPGGDADSAPTRLDRLLAFIARRRPRLRVFILIWDYGVLYTLERDPLARWRLGWRMPRGVRFGFDDRHPVGGCHHQKIVVVDDQLAFSGGIDLTGHRWDTSAHRVHEPHRVTPIGKHYGPYHEVQAMLSGPAATALGELARERWRAMGVERLPPVAPSGEDLWPDDVVPDVTDARVIIARTVPGTATKPAVRECERLFVDSIRMARRTIYIESQYFTNEPLAHALADRLREPDGPEIVLVIPEKCHGWLEQTTMGVFRDGVLRHLISADTYGRLRVVYPTASRAEHVATFIHSKVMVVDDTLARIGSANFSQRSMGVDTECDVAVEAGGDSEAQTGIRRIRDRLLGEHLGLDPDVVAQEAEHLGSLRAVIDAHRDGDHTLVPLDPPPPAEPPSPILRTAADPEETMAFPSSVEMLLPAVDATSGAGPLRLWILPAVVLAVGAAVAVAAWVGFAQDEYRGLQATLDAIPRAPGAIWIGAGVFLVAGILLVPLELLALLAGVLFGGVRGAAVGVMGSILAGLAGYAAGRLMGTHGLPRWISRRSYRSARQLGARGVLGIVVLRLAGIASAGSIHLVLGATRVPFWRFVAGTSIALAPAVVALCGVGALMRHTILEPSFGRAVLTIGAAALLLIAAAGLRALLLIRQFARSMAHQRERAEFG